MAKYLSQKQRVLNIGIVSYTEDTTALSVIGKVGIGTDNATSDLDVRGTLNVTGVSTFQGNVFLGDNDSLRLGDSSDLIIFHNGGHSFIDDNGAGSLYLRSSVGGVFITKTTGDLMGGFNPDGSVELYYNNAKKFETTGYGVTISGGAYVSSGSTITRSDSGVTLDVVGDFDSGVKNTLTVRSEYDRDAGIEIANSQQKWNIWIDGAADDALQFTDNSGNLNIELNHSGSTDLFYSNSKKFETTGIGISVSNGASTSATIAGPSELIIDPAAVGDNTGLVRIKGDLYVDGTTTQINSTSLEIADFIVGIASTATTDLLADGAGIQIGPDNTFLYEYNSGTNPSLKSSENLNVASGKVYQIAETERLSANTLSLGTGTTIHSPASNVLSLGVNGKSNIRVENTGDVTLNLSSTHQDEGILKFGRQDEFDRSHYIRVYNSSTQASNYMKFDVHNGVVGGFVTPLTLLGNGNVGIGTDNPSYKLHINDTASTGAGLLVQGGGGGGPIAKFERTVGSSGTITISSGAGDPQISFGSANNTFSLGTNGNNFEICDASAIGTDQRLVINTSGNVGIGTDNPTHRLTVDGSGTANTGTTIARFRNTSSTNRIDIIDETTTGNHPPGILSPAASYGLGLYASNGPIRFYPASTTVEKIRIDNSGNLLINTTSATGTSSQPLQVTGGAYVSGNLGIGDTNPQNKLKVYGNAWIDSASGDGQSRAQGLTVSNAPSADWTPGTDTGDGKRNTTFATKGSTRPVVVTWRNLDDSNAFWDFIADANTDKFYIKRGGTYDATFTWDTNQQVGIGTDVQSGSTLAVGGTITELYNGSYWNVVTQADVGYGASQVPLNQYLGQLAFLDDHHPNGLRRDGGGSDDVFVNSSGFVGIGTDNPQHNLDVTGNIRTTGSVFIDYGIYHDGDTNTSIQFPSNDNIRFTTNGFERVRVSSSGNVGIGTDNPGYKLQVEGDIKLAELGTLWFSDVSGSVEKIVGTSGELNLYADSEVRFYESDANTEKFSIDVNNARAFFENDDDTYWHRPAGDTHAWVNAGSESFRVTSAGDVGIGTAAPAYKLEVEGSRAWFKPNSDGTEAIALSLGRVSDSNQPFYDIITNDVGGDIAIHRINRYTGSWNFKRNSPTGEQNGLSINSSFSSGSSVSIGNSVGNTQVYLYTNGNSYFNNDGAVLVGSATSTNTANQKLQVTGGAYVSGNLGVGVTNPAVRLQLPGISTNTADFKIDEFFIQNYSLNNTFFGNNAPWNGSSHTRSKTGSVELFQFFSGGFQIRLHPSDVAGTPIPENSNFKIKSTGEFGIGSSITGANFDGSTFYHNSQGNIGINTTNPQYKLHVIGSFAATTKSFVIDHPTKDGMKLRYGSLEGPENGVYVRGRLKGNNTIELPEYWTELVDEDSITVNLTPIGRKAPLHSVVDIVDNTVVIESANDVVDCFYTVFAERKDVEKLEVEF